MSYYTIQIRKIINTQNLVDFKVLNIKKSIKLLFLNIKNSNIILSCVNRGGSTYTKEVSRDMASLRTFTKYKYTHILKITDKLIKRTNLLLFIFRNRI